jgi:hypothetical protein
MIDQHLRRQEVRAVLAGAPAAAGQADRQRL